MSIRGVRHDNQIPVTPTRAFFEGVVALLEGQGVCWVRDKVTTETGELVGDPFAGRTNRVDTPSNTNNGSFAGVVAHAYPADAEGQWIEMYEPGQEVLILVNADTTINATHVTCQAGTSLNASSGIIPAGIFTRTGFQGRGTAKVLETQVMTLDTNGDPIPELVLAELMDGDESGLVEELLPVAPGGGVLQSMVGGLTYLAGGMTLTADATTTLADGLQIEAKKGFNSIGAIGGVGFGYNVALSTVGVRANDSTALNTIELDAAIDISILEWMGDKWKLIHNTGSALT